VAAVPYGRAVTASDAYLGEPLLARPPEGKEDAGAGQGSTRWMVTGAVIEDRRQPAGAGTCELRTVLAESPLSVSFPSH